MKKLAKAYGVSRRAIERQLGIHRPSTRARAVGPQQRRVVQKDTPSSSSAVEPQSNLPKNKPAAEAVDPPANKPAEAVVSRLQSRMQQRLSRLLQKKKRRNYCSLQ